MHTDHVAVAAPSFEPGAATGDDVAEDRRQRAEIARLVQAFRGQTEHWLQQLSAAGSQARLRIHEPAAARHADASAAP